MSEPIQLDEFLTSQSSDTSGFTATLEPIDDKPSAVRVTPYREDRGCGCASSFELPKEMIESVVPTSRYHYCCGKRLEVVVVSFTDNAAVPVAELMKPMDRSGGDHHAHGPGPGSGSASGFSLSRVAGTDTPPPRPPGGVGGQLRARLHRSLHAVLQPLGLGLLRLGDPLRRQLPRRVVPGLGRHRLIEWTGPGVGP